MVQAVVLLVILKCWLSQVFCSSVALEEPTDTKTVFVRENETVELQWSLFIGENAGRSSVNVMIKKRDALLCQWVKAHGESNRCDPEMNLRINPERVRVPGPTNITATFSFRNKWLVNDGTYECRLVIDEKWHEVQVYTRYLVTTAEPIVTLNATYNNTCITDIICHVRGGRPKPVETILIKNGTEISRSKLNCQEEAGDTDCDEAYYCSSIHSVENSGGQFKCRVEHAGYVVDSAEVDIPFRTKENETVDPRPVCTAVVVMTSIIGLIMVMVMVLVWKKRKRLKNYDRATHVQSKGETEQFCAQSKDATDIEGNEHSIASIQVTDDQEGHYDKQSF